jgi:hypothetical protein
MLALEVCGISGLARTEFSPCNPYVSIVHKAGATPPSLLAVEIAIFEAVISGFGGRGGDVEEIANFTKCGATMLSYENHTGSLGWGKVGHDLK